VRELGEKSRDGEEEEGLCIILAVYWRYDRARQTLRK